jgi:iron complex outermembrane receptor protein
MNKLIKASLLASVAVGSMATAAYAQDEQATSVDEIVVTARRTEESLQRVPASVSAFSGERLERQGVTTVTDLQGQVPNLNLVQGRASGDSTNIYIRGVGQPDALQTFDPAVGVYVDDVYYSRIRGTQFELFDLERIEVLRGPQGTLYGKNTIGGALKLVTRRPGDEFDARAAATFGSYEQLDARVSVSGPVTDDISVGVAAMTANHDGYVTDPVTHADYNDKHVNAARVALAWDINDHLSWDIAADITDEDNAMTVGRQEALIYTANVFPIAPLGPITVLQPAPAPGSEFNFHTRTTPGLPNSSTLQHWGLASTATLEITDTLTLKSITAYRDLSHDDYIDFDATQYELADALVSVDQNQFSQEFQFNWEVGDWNVVSGVYYMREHITSHQEAYDDDAFTIFSSPVGFTRFIDDHLDTESQAFYINGTYQWTDALRLSLGARLTHEQKDYFRTTTADWSAILADTTFAFTADESWVDFSPSASLDYQFTPDMMGYLRVAKGFKSGGFNGRANNPGEESPYKPETVISYEAGVKSQWFDNRLTANASVFYNDYRNFQARVSGFNDDVPPSIALTVLNAGSLQISGAELELAARPVDGLSLTATVGYLDAQYDEFEDTRFPGGDRSFQTPPFSPEWTLRLGGQYEFDLADMGSVTLGGAASFRSELALAVDSTTTTGVRYPGMWQDDYWLFDARVVWASADGRFTAGVYGKNLGDEVYKTDAQEFSAVGGIQTAYYGAPRTVSFTVTARY